ncbi:DUF4224 domain-containing protein [Paraburkholderia panacisoli]|jgi:hypothetical protein|nr:DUF4224 domain-containing protein [Paraburkholderia panacisoli]
MFLSADELVELTGRRRREAQAQALRMMGIERKMRAGGRLVVSRRHVEQVLGVASAGPVDVDAMNDWSAALWLLAHADGKVTEKIYRRRAERVKPLR